MLRDFRFYPSDNRKTLRVNKLGSNFMHFLLKKIILIESLEKKENIIEKQNTRSKKTSWRIFSGNKIKQNSVWN